LKTARERLYRTGPYASTRNVTRRTTQNFHHRHDHRDSF
jgi:hypothetical protein